MGKRRTDLDHKTRYDQDDDDDDVVEEEQEQEPLTQEQKVNILSRKKLVAKRRVIGSSSDTSASVFSKGSTPFSFLSKPSEPTSSEDDKPAPSVFSGFKGFTAFKSSTTTTTTTPSLTSSTSTTTSSLTATGPTLSFGFKKDETPLLSNGSKPLEPFSLISSSKPESSTTSSSETKSLTSNGDHKQDKTDSSVAEDKDKSKNKNISEAELKFISELNDLYERCYGTNKRVCKLPVEALESSTDDQETKYACLLSELNKHCSKWISKHVEESPLVILTPVFVDYFNYLILLEKQFFPSTFSSKKTELTEPVVSVPKPTLFNGNLFNGSAKNGHKQEEEKKEADTSGESDKSKENDDIYETNKKFPSLVKSQTQPFAPISLTSNTNTPATSNFSFGSTLSKDKLVSTALPSLAPTTTTTSSFFGKPTAETSEKTSSTLTPFFKFNSSTDSTTAAPAVLESKPAEEKKETPSSTTLDSTPKLMFSGFSSLTTPTFKFGATTTSTADSEKTKDTKSVEEVKKTETETPSSTSFKLPSSGLFSVFNKDQTASSTTIPVSTEDSKPKPTESSIFKGFTAFPTSTTSTSTPNSTTTTTTTTSASTFGAITTPASTTTSIFSSFGSTTTTSAPFSFGTNLTANKSSIFGSTTLGTGDSKSIFGSSTFGSSNLTPFGSAPIQASTEGGGDAEDEPYEPPKPETSDTKEEGAVFTKRCKLFYFSDKEKKFCDRGIGNLFIKPINNGESTQLIVRADTKLATLLLNVKLSKVLPVNKVGAKDVSYLCVPNPPIPNVDDKAPCKFLFKVKTEDDAQELFDKLNEYKR